MPDIGSLQSISIAILHIGVGLALLLSIIEITKKDGKSGLVIVGLLATSIHLRLALLLAGEINQYPWLLFLTGTSLAAAGPAIWLVVKEAASFAYAERPALRLLHFVPAVLISFFELYFQLLPTSEKQAQIDGFIDPLSWNFLDITIAVSYLISLGYFLCIFFAYKRIRRDYEIRYDIRVGIILLIPIVAAIGAFVGFHFGMPWLLHVGGWAITIGLGLIFFFKETAIGFFDSLRDEIKEKRYAKTQLTGIDIDKSKRLLLELMEAKHLYRDSDLRISSVASKLMLQPNQLSRIINESYEKNFNEFLNEFRLREACELLLEEPEGTILAIAYRVGFNNKATFNAQFMKAKGMTPTQFRKLHEGKKSENDSIST